MVLLFDRQMSLRENKRLSRKTKDWKDKLAWFPAILLEYFARYEVARANYVVHNSKKYNSCGFINRDGWFQVCI